ncbi:copper-translocating P-type ATPase [Luminiphilus syltensis NOR5-1B]|uniref:Copper-exporting P-type ATPase n=1 Tax=Luminiphilus syltensis NOR5-1B TaxID=565045 RepID=B8KSD1_9GAMM|nr:heavy metal translocating P-type ATPase [Luminiphilus syltensis]EED35471.1 copper-translocating P-type ATPase [Luminiphilus syltensis NOR5-1B]
MTTTPASEEGLQQRHLLAIDGAHCASCVGKIERALQAVPAVEQASMNLAEHTASVIGQVNNERLLDAVQNAGYRARLLDEADLSAVIEEQQEATHNARRRAWRSTVFALGLGLPVMAYGWLGGSMLITSPSQQLGWGAIGLLTLTLMLTTGRHFYSDGLRALFHGNATMDSLIAIGTFSAWFYSMLVVVFPSLFPVVSRYVYFEASAMILGLISLGQALEANAKAHSTDALKRLLSLQPDTAHKIDGDTETDVPVRGLKRHDEVRVKPGERMPVDGSIIEGTAYVDESMLTGEPMPRLKNAGDTVTAGTVNGSSSIRVRVASHSAGTTLARITRLVREAQSSKPAISRLADDIAAWFVPAVMATALISALAWLSFGPDPSITLAFVVFTSVLIIACPCALGLATPMAVIMGVGKAAEFGALIRRGDALQTAAKITHLVIDKTGTLTAGRPRITQVDATGTHSIPDVMALLASVETHSEHPIARAVVDYASQENLQPIAAKGFKAHVGQGVEAMVDEWRILAGNQQFLQHHGVDTGQASVAAVPGQTVVFVAIDETLAATVCIDDPLRHDAKQAVERIKSMGIKVAIFTGDAAPAATRIAHDVGIERVENTLLPQDKAALISAMRHPGAVIAMAGDGINDAPALASADIGFAMGSGTDIAIESADITLLSDSLTGVADTIALSRATIRTIKQNLFAAFIYNAVGIPIAAGALYPFTGSLLSPVVAGGAMALSSLSVVTNATRLRFFKAGGSAPSFSNDRAA